VTRPLPIIPRGPKRADDVTSASLFLAVPRISPEWELAARLALVKPKPYTKRIIEHNAPRQPWPRNARRLVESFIDELSGDVASSLRFDFPRIGEHRLRVELIDLRPLVARRIARELSRLLPELWFTLGDADYLRAGVFYRRVGKYKLELVRSRNVRLRRSIRFGFLGDVDDAIAPAGDRAARNAAAQ
jgi:hypothetical protein